MSPVRTAPLTVSLTDAAEMLGMSRSEAYRRNRNASGWLVPGHVVILKMGPRLARVPVAQLDEYLATGGHQAEGLGA